MYHNSRNRQFQFQEPIEGSIDIRSKKLNKRKDIIQ
jgi:hypothetical protein